MSIDKRLLDILICPACGAGIVPVAADSGLECQGCGRVYPVRDGIPVMLVEEASEPAAEGGAEIVHDPEIRVRIRDEAE